MALRPKWAVPQVAPALAVASHIVMPPAAAAAGNQTVSPPAATASASGPVPVPQLNIPAPAATASASGPIPVPQLRISPAAATASASAPTPVPADGIIVPLATASANGPPPVPKLTVPPAAATASASAPIPTVSPFPASFVADLFAPVADTTTGTAMTATTAVTVAAGDSAIIEAGARGGTTTAQTCTLSGLPGDAVVEKSPDSSQGGSPAVQAWRVYFPTGMASSTVLTFTWAQSATRKEAAGQVITNLQNANGLWSFNNGTGALATPGTTAATTTVNGWHTAAWHYQSPTAGITVTPGSDEGGTMTERADIASGATALGYLYVEDRSVAAAHAGGMTATATASTAPASWAGVQGVWSGAGVADQSVSPPVATGSASANAPTLPVSAPAVTASASSPTPAVQLQVAAPAATASASSPVPVLQLRVSPAAATASASSPLPAVQAKVSPAAATASASSLVPVPQLRVIVPTKGSIVLGYTNQLLTGTQAQDVERLMGRTFRGLRQNQNISVSGWSTAVSEYALGRKLTYRSVDINSGTWADVTAGTHDTELLAIASNLVATGLWSPSNPAYICFMHEATVSSNSVFGTGQDYINAYRHVVDLWDANGYTVTKKDGTANGGPIVMVLVHFQRAFTNTLELGGTETPPAGLAHADFDPDGGSSPAPGGTTYYSGIGIDAYNSITSAGHLKYGTTASNLLNGVFTQAHNTGKFTFIGEFGCEDGTTTTDHQNKADWLDSVRAYLSSKVGTVEQTKALLLTVKTSVENYNVDSSQQSIDAFKRLGMHSDFYPEYATGFGNNPALPISVPVATAAASAPVPLVYQGQTVSPPAATASASGPVPVPQLRVFPTPATATVDLGAYTLSYDTAFAEALVPTVGTSPTVSPPVATASASAPVPTPQLNVSSPAATAAASAPVPTVALDNRVSPPAATASASSPVPTVQLKVSPAAATANASAPVPTVAIDNRVLPPAATASASAPTPVPDLKVSPAAATASVSAPVPIVTGGQVVSPPSGTASASAPVPTVQLRVSPAAATANASAPVPTVTVGQNVAPPAATASASALVPVPQLRLTPPVASSNASAPVSGVGASVLPPAGTASATAPVPTPQLQVLSPVATASASSPIPTPQDQLTPPAATANASAPIPTIQVRVIVPAATANASAPAPTISGVIDQIVLPPVATASASAKLPTVTAKSTVSPPVALAAAFAPVPAVIMPQWPPDSGLQWPEHDYRQWPDHAYTRW